MRQRDGAELWRNEKLKRRGLSTPVVTSTAIAVADFQGYLHWLDKNTGELVARERVAKKQRVSNPPVGAGDTVVVLTDGGTLAAYRATPKFSSPRPAPASEPIAPAREPTAPAHEATPTAPPPAATESVPPAENPAPQPAAPPPVTPPPVTPPPATPPP
jgi:hypothetical protein